MKSTLKLLFILTWSFLLIFQLKAQFIKTFKKLPDTGQNSSYTSTFGEDHDYQFNTPGFLTLSNNRVLDTITSLVWQKTDGGEMTHELAILFCDTLTLDNLNDWRLPLAAELFTIQNLQYNNPALNTTVFTKTTAEYWWSSEKQVNDPNKVWCTNSGGGIGNHPKVETMSAGGVKKFHARCVRTDLAPSVLNKRFVSTEDSSVIDSMNLLQWQIFPPDVAKTWEDALVYAENLILDGHSDWRLPNIKELRSLNDEKKVNPSIDNSIFKFGVRKFWSSTSLPNQTTKAWYFESNNGITTYEVKTNSQYVICVRTPDKKSTMSAQNKLFGDIVVLSQIPADKELKIRVPFNSAPQSLQLISNLGQVISSIPCFPSGNHWTLDVSGLKDGIYILNLSTELGICRKTICVSHSY